MHRALLTAALLLTSCQKPAPTSTPAAVWDPAPEFWIWNHYTPLPEKALAELKAAQVTSIYWLFAEIPPAGPARKQLEPELLDQLRATPVIRLPAGTDTLLKPAVQATLHDTCRQLFRNSSQQHRLQIDYDCPASGLAAYADILHTLRREFAIEQLSITALASWINAPNFELLASSVDELAPMFYDLEPDLPAEITDGSPRPMLDAASLRWIEKWKSCPSPWRAGLPNFQRLSLFRPDGHLVGHLQSWSIGAILSHPALKLKPNSTDSILQFSVTADTRISQVSIKTGQQLILRMPDQTTTLRALDAARRAGALGSLWFAHPDSAPVAWHSVPHLAALQRDGEAMAEPAFSISKNGSITLSNRGPGDISPHSLGQPWQLILEAKSPGSFQSLGPGEFFRIDAPGSSLAHPELSKIITLSFFALPSGHSIRSQANFVKAPAPTLSWRIKP